MALDHIDPKNDRDYHISFDIDALDRHEAPCTGYSRKCFVFSFSPSSSTNFQLILLFSIFFSLDPFCCKFTQFPVV